MFIKNDKILLDYRRSLRNNMTPAEVILWSSVRKSQLGVRFYRQYSIGTFILDFYCPKYKLAIEVDGEMHNDPIHQANDELRTQYLNRNDITVIRFDNNDIFLQLDNVLAEIKSYIDI